MNVVTIECSQAHEGILNDDLIRDPVDSMKYHIHLTNIIY